jgi:hypothetical protein
MQSKGTVRKLFVCGIVLAMNVQLFPMAPQTVLPSDTAALSSLVALPGQSLTALPNGGFLLLGGIGRKGSAVSTATIGNPRTGSVTVLRQGLNVARAWHTASVLPDGTVFVFGGEGSDGNVVSQAEVFDPVKMTFRMISVPLTARAHHTATLLTDGRLLLDGGTNAFGDFVLTAETWDSRRTEATVLNGQLPEGRLDDHSALLPDGTALIWGGRDALGNRLDYAEFFDPKLGRFLATTPTEALGPDLNLPFVEDSTPEDGAVNVPVDGFIGVRFSKLLQAATVTPKTVNLQSVMGSVPALVVPAENGRLAFVNPTSHLMPGTKYSLTLQGATDGKGLPVSYNVVMFTTAGSPNVTAGSKQSTDSPSSTPPQAPVKVAPAGVTAVAGQTLRLDGSPLPNVTLKIADTSTRSDRYGRFLLANIPSGFQTLYIDGRSANVRNHAYGVFEAGVQVQQGKTFTLPYTIWMTELDMAHAVHVHFPTLGEVVVTTPTLPGLEFHIPPNTTITDIDGKVANLISITPVPIDHPPFPLPHISVPIYFTIQPGGGKIWVYNPGNGPQGGRLFYPNLHHQTPGTLVDFWNYDSHSPRGWFIYGKGRVSPDASTIVPNPGVEVYELTGAMVGGASWAPANGTAAGGNPGGQGADPVDLSTGLFIYRKTDLYLPDTIPISASRVYRQNDTMVRAFGVATSIAYDMWLEGNLNDFGYLELVQADGSRLRFDRIAGNSYLTSTLVCASCPGPFSGAVFYNTTPGLSINCIWDIRLREVLFCHFCNRATDPDRAGQTINNLVSFILQIEMVIRYGYTELDN